MKNLLVILILTQLILADMTIISEKTNSYSYDIGQKLSIKNKIINIESKGHLENLVAVTKRYDILSIVPADMLSYINKFLPRKMAKVRVVAKLPSIQVHLIVKKSSSIYSLDDLIEKKINIGDEFESSNVFSSIFESYFALNWKKMTYSTDVAFNHLLNGYKKLDAIILVGKAPLKVIEKNLSEIRFIELPLIGDYDYDTFELKDKYEIFESKKTLEIPLLLLVNRGYHKSNKSIIKSIFDNIKNIYGIDTCIEPSVSVSLNFEFAKKQFCYKRSIQ
jgi:hypothetical protein